MARKPEIAQRELHASVGKDMVSLFVYALILNKRICERPNCWAANSWDASSCRKCGFSLDGW
jgi:ribosomal protein L40E